MFHTTIDLADVQDFRGHLHGELICKGDEEYDCARKVWNGMIDKHPLLIIRCADVADVVSAVQFARSRHLPIAVRGGGHNVGGKAVCDKGIVVDLSQMKGIQVDLIRPMSYLEAISMLDVASPAGHHYYFKTSILKSLSDEAINAIVEYGLARTSPFTVVLIEHLHGAASRVGPMETAFAQRDESYIIGIFSNWTNGEADTHIGWTQAFWKATEPWATGVYVNYLGEEGEERVQAAYGINYRRLVALKNKYDPANFFHLNQNIRPTAQESRL